MMRHQTDGPPSEKVGQWLKEAAPRRPQNDREVAVLKNCVDYLYRIARAKPAGLVARATRAEMRQARLGEGLRILLKLIPEMVENGELVADEVDHAYALVAHADWLSKNGPVADPPKPGPRGQRWAAAARLLAEHAIRVWRVPGQNDPSHQTADGPVVRFVAKALDHIEGTSPSHDTIAKQLQRTPPASVASVKLNGGSDRPHR